MVEGENLSLYGENDHGDHPVFESVNAKIKRGFSCDVQISEASNKRLKQTPQTEAAKLDETLPKLPTLGLTLRKSPSFLEFMEMKLSEAKNTKYVTEKNQRSGHGAAQAKIINDAEKMKASNFCALSVEIGSWKKEAEREGALVAKCYYAKRKLVWEILQKGLKQKIEIQWPDISAIRATIVENKPGILEIELNQPPGFYEETNPQPRKHTIWKGCKDFTANQASMSRRHYLKFSPGVLDKHFEKLLQCDCRLLELSRKPFPSYSNPFFCTDFYNGIRQFSLNQNEHVSNVAARLQLPYSNITAALLAAQKFQSFEHSSQTSFTLKKDSTSPISVMEFPSHSDEIISNQGVEELWVPICYRGISNSAVDVFGRSQVQDPLLVNAAAPTQLNPTISCQSYGVPAACDEGGMARLNSQMLEHMTEALLGESDTTHFDQNQHLARKDSLSNYLYMSNPTSHTEILGNSGNQLLGEEQDLSSGKKSSTVSLSKEENHAAAINTTTEHTVTNNGIADKDFIFGAYESSGFYSDPGSWMPFNQAYNQNPMMHLPGDNSFSIAPNPTMADFANGDIIEGFNWETDRYQ